MRRLTWLWALVPIVIFYAKCPPPDEPPDCPRCPPVTITLAPALSADADDDATPADLESCPAPVDGGES